MRVLKSISIFFVMALSLLSLNVHAKDFAEQKIVLQISDADKQVLVLNVASNLVKHYGQDQVDVEIVAFGPGLGLLVDGAKNKNKDRISGLASSGVKFSACGNTMKKMAKKNNGKEPKILAQAKTVEAGVVRIIDLQSNGYKLIKP